MMMKGSLILLRTEQFQILLRCLSLSILMVIFQVDFGWPLTKMSLFWILLELRLIETYKVPVKILQPTNQYPDFYRPDALSVANQQCESTEGFLVICLVCGPETGSL